MEGATCCADRFSQYGEAGTRCNLGLGGGGGGGGLEARCRGAKSLRRGASTMSFGDVSRGCQDHSSSLKGTGSEGRQGGAGRLI